VRAAEHPLAEEPWFQALPANRREEFTQAWFSESARFDELDRREVRRRLREVAQMALLFAAADFLCPGRSITSVVESVLVGAVVGRIANRLDLARFSTSALGLVSMILVQWTTRGGLTLLHLLVFYPFTSFCALLGYFREEHGRD
jgi:hypothetical protein